MANQTGTLYSYNVDQTGNSVPAAVGASADLRRIHNFGDRIAELAPEESPFFVYLSKVGKVPTSDSQFRFLEDRTKISIADRAFLAAGGFTAAAVGDTVSAAFDTVGGASVDWLVPGMVISCGTVDTSTAQPEWCTV